MPEQYHPDIKSIKETLTFNTAIDAQHTILDFFHRAKDNKKIDIDAYTVIKTTLNQSAEVIKQLSCLNDILKKDNTDNQVLYITGEIYNNLINAVRYQKVKAELALHVSIMPPASTEKSSCSHRSRDGETNDGPLSKFTRLR